MTAAADSEVPIPDAVVDRITNPPPMHPSVVAAGQIRCCDADFEVEELPAYYPAGEGEHCYLWIEKRGISTEEVKQRLARQLKLRSADIGVAGQKDAHAVTRQFISLRIPGNDFLQKLRPVDFRIISHGRHRNKLRTGHLKGNRFCLVIRPVDQTAYTPADAARVQQRLCELSADGIPNYFGRQRFGRNAANIVAGVRLLTAVRPRKMSRFRTRMLASAAQAAVFNLVVADRLKAGHRLAPVTGDVVCRWDGVKPFLMTELCETQAKDVVAMGPMYGPGMVPSERDALTAETKALQTLGLTSDDFTRARKWTPGARRRMLVRPCECTAALTDDGHLRLQFELPAGSYATVLLREIFGSVSDVGGRAAPE